MYNYVYICHIHGFMIFYGHLWLYIHGIFAISPDRPEQLILPETSG